jgi:hypothetical protein
MLDAMGTETLAARAGELCERVDVLHLVDPSGAVETVPTYRGEDHLYG